MALAIARVRGSEVRGSEKRPKSLPKLVDSPAGPPKFLGRIMTPVFPRSAVTPGTRATALDFARSRTETKMGFINVDMPEDGEFYDSDEDDDVVSDVSEIGVDPRVKAERAAEFEVAHNWMLKEETEIQSERFSRAKKRLTISLPDDDPLEGISNRLEEVQSMVKPKVEFTDFLEELNPEQKDRILKLTDMDLETVKSIRRKDWKPVNYLRHAFRMVYLMEMGASRSRRYFNPDDPEAGPAVMRKQRQLYKKGKSYSIKSSISIELQEVLETNPVYRTNEHIKRVTWLLKTTKAFKHLFPTEMIEEVAKVVAYERYDDNRHIAYQGKAPERFYYVLSGRRPGVASTDMNVHRLREYKLTSGCVNKPMGFMYKGSTSDPDEMEQQWTRECHLVAKGPVEVLILAKDDFIRLQHTTQGPPIDFLYSIELFKEFPCEIFADNDDAYVYKYYGQNKVICGDVNRTAWLHVVKSVLGPLIENLCEGNVKVVRRQHVVDTRSNNETKFQARNTDELGCGRSFSHAKAMLGNLTSQRKLKNVTDVSLPELMRRRSTTLIEEGMRGGRKKKHVLKLTTPVIREMSSRGGDSIAEESEGGNKENKKDLTLPPIVVSNGEPSVSQTVSSPSSTKDGKPGQAKQSSSVKVYQLNAEANGSTSLQPHGTFLTREKTSAEIEAMFTPKKPKKEIPQRQTCVQLDLLKPGDVFGLDDVAKKFRSESHKSFKGLETLDLPTIQKIEGPSLSLVSDGAEVIKISKRFFLQHAQNNTMLRVETMQRSYLSTNDAKGILYDKETWGQYKEALMSRLIASLPGLQDMVKSP